MKNKYLQLIMMGLIFLGLVFLLFYFFEANAKYVIAICLGGLVIGLSVKLIKSFLIPSQWIFNHRFGFKGLLFTILILLIVSLTNFYELSIKNVIIDLLFSVVFGFFLMGNIYRSNYNKKVNTITSDNLNVDSQILTDLASYKEDTSIILGKLILTEQKLLFIPANTDIPMTEIDLSEQKQLVRIRKGKFGLPNGIIVNDNLKLSLSYPRLWIKKIAAA